MSGRPTVRTRRLPGTRCCPHPGFDHGGESANITKPGDACTVPGCECKGWVKQVRRGKAPAWRVR